MGSRPPRHRLRVDVSLIASKSGGRLTGCSEKLERQCRRREDATAVFQFGTPGCFHVGAGVNTICIQRFGPALLRSPSGRGRFASRSSLYPGLEHSFSQAFPGCAARMTRRMIQAPEIQPNACRSQRTDNGLPTGDPGQVAPSGLLHGTQAEGPACRLRVRSTHQNRESLQRLGPACSVTVVPLPGGCRASLWRRSVFEQSSTPLVRLSGRPKDSLGAGHSWNPGYRCWAPPPQLILDGSAKSG